MHRLHILKPAAGEVVRLGERLSIHVDLDLDEPWFARPDLGKKLPSIDENAGHRGLAFETRGDVPVLSLTKGTAEVQDTRVDDLAKRGGGDPRRAGRGHEVVVTTGALRFHYGHLRRGTGRAGPVAVGQPIGYSGASGRCVDGAGRTFVHLEARHGSTPVDLERLFVPLEVVAFLGTTPLGRPARLPAGEVHLKGFVLEGAVLDEAVFASSDLLLEVRLRRGANELLARRHEVSVRPPER